MTERCIAQYIDKQFEPDKAPAFLSVTMAGLWIGFLNEDLQILFFMYISY
jgi:hypothetical protein